LSFALIFAANFVVQAGLPGWIDTLTQCNGKLNLACAGQFFLLFFPLEAVILLVNGLVLARLLVLRSRNKNAVTSGLLIGFVAQLLALGALAVVVWYRMPS
jgi:hypothetical protein